MRQLLGSDNNRASQISEYDEDHCVHPADLSGDEEQQKIITLQQTSFVHPNKPTNLFFTSMIIAKTAFGAGIISMPYTVNHLGWAIAPIAFVVFFMMNQFSSVILLKSKNLSRHSNFSTILYYISNSIWVRVLGSIIILLDNSSTCVVFFILIKTIIPKVAKDLSNDKSIIENWYFQGYFIVLALGICLIPLILIRKIQKLKVYSFVGVTGVIIFIIGLIIAYINTPSKQIFSMEPFPRNTFRASSALFNIAFAFSFQVNFFPIYKGLYKPTDIRMGKACLIGILTCVVPYILVGYLGYLLVGPQKDANFLTSLSYQKTDPFIYFLINVSYVFSTIFSVVLYFFGCRNNFISMVKILRKRWNGEQIPVEEQNYEDLVVSEDIQMLKKEKRQYTFLTLFIFFVILGISIPIQDINKVLNFLGAFCQTLVTVVLPCTFYIVLVRRFVQIKRWKYFVSILLLIMMSSLSAFSVVSSYIQDEDLV